MLEQYFNCFQKFNCLFHTRKKQKKTSPESQLWEVIFCWSSLQFTVIKSCSSAESKQWKCLACIAKLTPRLENLEPFLQNLRNRPELWFLDSLLTFVFRTRRDTIRNHPQFMNPKSRLWLWSSLAYWNLWIWVHSACTQGIPGKIDVWAKFANRYMSILNFQPTES